MWIATMILTFILNKIFSSNFCFKLKNLFLSIFIRYTQSSFQIQMLSLLKIVVLVGSFNIQRHVNKHINTEQNLKEEIFW